MIQPSAPAGVWAPCDAASEYWMLFITSGGSERERRLLSDLQTWQALSAPVGALVRCWSGKEGRSYHDARKTLGVDSLPTLVFSHSPTMFPGLRLSASRLAKVAGEDWGAPTFFQKVHDLSYDGLSIDEIFKHFRKAENWDLTKKVAKRLAGELPGVLAKVGMGIGGAPVS